MKIEINDVSKVIQGSAVLDHISLTLESGKIYGIYGHNGSGKTMLLRAVSGICNITGGEILCDGKRLHRDMDILPDMGMIIENIGFWKNYTGYGNLRMLADIRKTVTKERISETLRLVGLDPADRRTVRKYSLGMRQRLAIAQALMEKPRVLLLDEPTNALDRGGVRMFRELMQKEREAGTLIVMASHNQDDIELLSDVRLHMEDGRIKEVNTEEKRTDEEHVDEEYARGAETGSASSAGNREVAV